MNLIRPLSIPALLCSAFLLLSIGDASAVAPYHYPVQKLDKQSLKTGYSWSSKKLQQDHPDRVSTKKIGPRDEPFVRYSRPRKTSRVFR